MASWDIGAVQLEGSATDIGAVQAAAVVVGGNPWNYYAQISSLLFSVLLKLSILCFWI